MRGEIPVDLSLTGASKLARSTALLRIQHLQSFNWHLVKFDDVKVMDAQQSTEVSPEVTGMFSSFILLQAWTNNWSGSIFLSFVSENTWLLNNVRMILVSYSTQELMLCAIVGGTNSFEWLVSPSILSCWAQFKLCRWCHTNHCCTNNLPQP